MLTCKLRHQLSRSLTFLVIGCLFIQGAKAFISSSHPVASSGRCCEDKSVRPLLEIRGSTEENAKILRNNVEEEVVEANALLMDAINTNTTAASSLLTSVNEMRENGKSREQINQYLENLLSTGPDVASLPFWTRSKRIARFSRRARMASLRRTLDISTPPPSESEEENNKSNNNNALQRRCRALLSLLQSISSDDELKDENKIRRIPSIVSLEKRALQSLKDDATNLRNLLPEGLETPDYDVVVSRDSSQKKIEIRRYKPYSVCAVTMNKPRPSDAESRTDAKIQMKEMSGASSFGALAGYLFGKNDQSTPMKMTTPVLTTPNSKDEKQMEFVLPSEYWNSDSLMAAPQPLSGSGVTLQQKESEERAVLLFGGYATKKEVEKRKQELTAALTKDCDWKAEGEEEATLAQYNDPFTVPWRRLNEVSVKVVKK